MKKMKFSDMNHEILYQKELIDKKSFERIYKK